MTRTDRILAARAYLLDKTPLKADCGRQCGGACCRPDETGRGGMLLFPGEAALYDPVPEWAALADSGWRAGGEALPLLVCDGTCDRANRPLACRVFPLTPLVRAGTLTVVPDVRAWPVCPLMPHGVGGLSPAFVDAVREAMALLFEDAECRAYMEALSGHLEGYGAL